MPEYVPISNSHERPLPQDQLVLSVSEVALLGKMPSLFYGAVAWIVLRGKKETIENIKMNFSCQNDHKSSSVLNAKIFVIHGVEKTCY